ncbi:MAG: IclR family transcriptional regulator [Solirubrobacteraceae bacterium]
MARTNGTVGPLPVQSVGRSLDLLEAIADEELGLVALAKRVGFGPSTAYRLLATLAARGYVTRSAENGTYRLGPKLLEMAAAARDQDVRLRAIVHPHLRALRDATGETANLVVADDDAVVYVDQAESPQSVRLFTTIGRRVPLHASGGGKAIAAFSPPAAVDELVAGGLARLTERTLVTSRAFGDEMARIRARGYAIDDEEYETGVVCVAAALRGADGEPVAAVTVSGPAARMRGHGLDALGALVRDHADRASADLGAGAATPAGH